MFKTPKTSETDDFELLAMLSQEPAKAWDLFCEKYSNFTLLTIRRMGFDYDQTMERFVFIFEKLCEDDFRRLRSIKYPGEKGDLTPWLRQVIGRFCVNWAWSENGRKRLLGFVAEMPERDQRIFKIHFWQGKTPFGVYEALRLEHDKDVQIEDVFNALERIAAHLSEKKQWRLISGLSRMQRTLSLDKQDEETGLRIEPVDLGAEDPESVLKIKETNEKLNAAIETLSTREKLVMQFRYEESLTLGEVAKLLKWEKREAVNAHKSAIYKLRKILK